MRFIARSSPPARDDGRGADSPLPATANYSIYDLRPPLHRAVTAYNMALTFMTEARPDMMQQAVLALRDEAERIVKLCGAFDPDDFEDATQVYGEQQ